MELHQARNEAVALRELQTIYRRAGARRALRVVPMLDAAGVRSLLGMTLATIGRHVATGRLPPPSNKAVRAPTDPVERARWQRDHRRWNGRLMQAYAWGILPEVTRTFTSPEQWRAWLWSVRDEALDFQ